MNDKEKNKEQEEPLKIDGSFDDVLKVSVPKPKEDSGDKGNG